MFVREFSFSGIQYQPEIKKGLIRNLKRRKIK
jgi:hypothetical protein